jgi:hypothetical protein
MDIIERLDAAIKTEDFWVGDQREDNILKDSKKIIEQLRDVLQSISNNTCCDRCQEAALVARAALKEKE